MKVTINICCCDIDPYGCTIGALDQTHSEFLSRAMSVNISGVNKALLLRALWAHAADYFSNGRCDWFDHSGPTEAQCEELVKGYIGCVCGVQLDIDLTRRAVSPTLYDQRTSVGSFRRIVNQYIETRRSRRLREKFARIAGDR